MTAPSIRERSRTQTGLRRDHASTCIIPRRSMKGRVTPRPQTLPFSVRPVIASRISGYGIDGTERKGRTLIREPDYPRTPHRPGNCSLPCWPHRRPSAKTDGDSGIGRTATARLDSADAGRMTGEFRTGILHAATHLMSLHAWRRSDFLRPQCRLSDPRQTIRLFVGPCPFPAVAWRHLDRRMWVITVIRPRDRTRAQRTRRGHAFPT
jgi:hypothetical protein